MLESECRVHPHQNRIDLCNHALDCVRHSIPSAIHRDVHEYINEYNEWGLGMEILIDQIIELEVTITRGQFDVIQSAMASMNLLESDRMIDLGAAVDESH